MSLQILPFVLGPLENNTWLVADSESRQAAVIDPSFGIEPLIEQLRAENLQMQAVWLTHAHFDHFAGASQLIHALDTPVGYLVPEKDFTLWQAGGEARQFGIKMDLSAQPNILLKDYHVIQLGAFSFKVLPTPGHTLGHVTYYCAQAKAAFCGDVIFRYSIGRTDLNGGDYNALINSIETQILTMPPDTVLYSGHGENSTVADQLRLNPFVTLRTPRRESRE